MITMINKFITLTHARVLHIDCTDTNLKLILAGLLYIDCTSIIKNTIVKVGP